MHCYPLGSLFCGKSVEYRFIEFFVLSMVPFLIYLFFILLLLLLFFFCRELLLVALDKM